MSRSSLTILFNALLIMVLLVAVTGCVTLGKPAAGCQLFPASSQQKAADNKTAGPDAAPTPPGNQPGGGVQPPTPPVDQSGAGAQPAAQPSGQDNQVITQSGGVAVANWIGTWQCGQNKMYLNQSGDQVTGWYDDKDGRIKATASGNSLAGTWSESPSVTGNIKLIMSTDGKSFSGDYGAGPVSSWDRHWSCTRTSTARPPDPPSSSSPGSGVGVLQPGLIAPTGGQPGMGVLQPAQAASWTGTWQCGSTKLLLTQSGNQVTGYYDDNGRMEGTVTGNTLTGNWTMYYPEWSSWPMSGNMKLIMASDGKNFEWQYNTKISSEWKIRGKCTRESTDSPPSPSSSNWSGQWLCGQFGRLTLTQSGEQVTGTYTYEGGKVTGRAIGNMLVGTWSEQPTYNPPDDSGYFKFKMSADSNSFTGEWCYGSTGAMGSWKGQRDR